MSGTRSAEHGRGRELDSALVRALRPGSLLPVALLGAYVSAFAAWEFITRIRSPFENILANAGGLVPGVAATAIAWRVARHPSLAPPLRRAWRWLDLVLRGLLARRRGLPSPEGRARGRPRRRLARGRALPRQLPARAVGVLSVRSGRPEADERAALWLDADRWSRSAARCAPGRSSCADARRQPGDGGLHRGRVRGRGRRPARDARHHQPAAPGRVTLPGRAAGTGAHSPLLRQRALLVRRPARRARRRERGRGGPVQRRLARRSG